MRIRAWGWNVQHEPFTSPPSVHKVRSDGFCTKLRTVEVRREAATRCRRPIVVVVVVVDADGGRERSHWQIFVVDAIANGDDVFSSPSQTAVGRSRRVWVCSRTESTLRRLRSM